jgi:hypothetical protein
LVSFYSLKTDVGEGSTPAEMTEDVRATVTPQILETRNRNLAASLREMAEDTGGGFAFGTGAEDLHHRARSDLGGYYLLGFQPEREADGAYRKLEVKLRRRGSSVRHRAGYVDKPPAARIADRTTAALLLAHDDNPLGVELAIGPSAPGPSEQLRLVPVLVTIPLDFLDGLPDATSRVPATLYIAARDPEGRTAPVQELPIELDRESEESRQTTGFRLLLREGQQRVAVGLVVPSAGVSAFLSGDFVGSRLAPVSAGGV